MPLSLAKVAKCLNATCTGASTLTTVDSAGTVGLYNSITLGADGLPVISYYDQTNSDLKVAKCSSAACVPFVRRRERREGRAGSVTVAKPTALHKWMIGHLEKGTFALAGIETLLRKYTRKV